MKKYTILFFMCLGIFSLAQMKTLKGNAVILTENGEKIPVNGADVHWKEHTVMKTVTDSLGNFQLMYHDGLYNIVAEKDGFKTKEVKVESIEQPIEIVLETSEKTLNEVIVRQRAQAVNINARSADLIFNLSKTELLKAACCNLAESFETNPTVDVSTTNAATGSKQIKMLGLDQKYSSITVENMPEVRGLTSANGINFLSGTWINSIQLTKGGSTVINGYEAITGQINTELMKYQDKNFTNLNFYANQNVRLEFNAVNGTDLGNHWSNTSLLHFNGNLAKEDMNHDGFLDLPLSKQINAMNILRYDGIQTNGWASIFAVQALYDKQLGGQKDFVESVDKLKQNRYGLGIENTHFEVWNKTGYVFLNKSYQSIGLQTKYIHHDIGSYFGQRIYNGNENSLFANLIFESILGDTNNKYKLGVSFLHDVYNETFETDNYKRTENVPSVFAEYTNTSWKKLTVVAGLRADFHNLAGTQILPRLNVKYSLLPKTTLRLAAGRGMRTANVFAENMQYFASSRKVQIRSGNGDIYGLQPEIAWNYGASIVQDFKIGNMKNTFTLDFYRTDFQKQVLIDLDKSPQELWFYNLDGKSYSNSLQAVWDVFLSENLELHLAYKWYDIQAEYDGGKREIPFTAKDRALLNATYSTRKTEKNSKWTFDFTVQYIGKQRLPDTSSNPDEFQRITYSPDYFLANAQVSRHFSEKVRVYAGVENLGGYKQRNPIIEAENPFGTYFDTSLVYAPITPAMFYIGIDLKL
ncbi:MAG: TonB-dependent receptor [Flavobacteriaceae bacterium]|jgi:outer membrane receptor for ferrienterochelin and colicin|nr:TonB-dependent receptor [Flavobacteriaceae bacterium]